MPSMEELVQCLKHQKQILPDDECQGLLAGAAVAVSIWQHAVHMKFKLYLRVGSTVLKMDNVELVSYFSNVNFMKLRG